jgi:hypothetical protein
MSGAVKAGGVLIILAVVFLAGWYPQYRKASRLEHNLEEAQAASAALQAKLKEAEVRDLGAVLYLEVSRQNYEKAAAAATRFFDAVRDLSAQTQDAALQARLKDVLAKRDSIIAALARANPSVAGDLQAILLQLYGVSETQ